MSGHPDLRPYPEYRDSGLPWLRAIPAHWEVRHIRHWGRIIGGSTPSMKRSDFWGGVIPWISPKDMKRPYLADSIDRITETALEESAVTLLPRNAVVLVVRGMILAKRVPVAVTLAPVTINQDMKAIIPFANVEARYLMYAIEAGKDAFSLLIDEAGHGTKRLPTVKWRMLELAFPPPDEQRAIADFLDHHGRAVRRFIRNRRRLIEVLSEQKQAIIDRAVMRGLNGAARLKPSGVEGFGDIPSHWTVFRLRRLADVRLSSVDKITVDGETPVRLCNYVDVYRNDMITAELEFMRGSADAAEIRAFGLRAGDVLITKDSEEWNDIAVPAFVPRTLPDVVCGYHLAVVRPDPGTIDGEYLARAFTAESIAIQFRIAANGVTRYGLSKEAIKGAFFPVPPVSEQRDIAAFIAQQCASVGAAIRKAEREIDLMREYRTRLIADVVTGKVDVRGLAPTSVEVAGTEPEAIDDGVDEEMPEDVEVGESALEAADADD